jgi:tetratricopeptide (TPR) repeat protein
MLGVMSTSMPSVSPFSTPLLALALLAAPVLDAPAAAQDANKLVNDAWPYLPEYTAAERPYLSEEMRRKAAAGAKMLAAAIELDPSHARGLWCRGYAEWLLAVDAKNRGEAEAAQEHFGASVESFSAGIGLNETDPWALVGRAQTLASFGEYGPAIADMDAALASMAETLAKPGNHGSTPWLRFQAMKARAEILMQLGRFEDAREALSTFHGLFSGNNWNLYVETADSYKRERDFDSARATYEKILEEFENDFQAYALLGYLEGLVGDRAAATKRLQEALEYELQPGMYTRMWLTMLATDEARPAAVADFEGFMENPPDDLSEWDRTLGNFVLGNGTVEEFARKGGIEVARRMSAGEAVDDLPCEIAFYSGFRHEADAAKAGDGATQKMHQEKALAAYREALSFDPKWKDEWAYSRMHFARLTAELGQKTKPGFSVKDDRLSVGGQARGKLMEASWHAPGEAAAKPSLGRAVQPGDLLIGTLESNDGERRSVRLVVGLR